ncbi:1-acyl-sn-glycerol-3-phosphate acyltransferase [Porphyromonas cangingivalis]|uniref:1-acyl-sn-glycerol-3-phosphate acyltransferase n=1 Tax=Porphyromonas cangingivalis TaxID=36874 RepID=UPI00051CF3B5|nr:1-acyl-sn-glycerol-3-phosphate acyltransferase [Porphyromonas cangingivalis]KGL49516.1 hypothetical protein HQ34_05180 [Porphyromonas cangingivalis]
MKRIEIAKIIRQKYNGYLPKWVVRLIEKLIHQDEINDILALQNYVDGVAFADKVMEALRFSVSVHNGELLPQSGRYIFISNHPLGGADGVILTSVLGKFYGGKINFLVNDLLMSITQFGDVFLPVNKYGRQSRSHLQKIEEALSSDRQIVTFPAGLCSREEETGDIRDLRWSHSFIKMARKYDRDIVPIFFDSQNSPNFYKWARRRVRLGMKFNYELILLPDELFRAKGTDYNIYIGKPIRLGDLDKNVQDDNSWAQSLKDYIYTIPVQPQFR